MARRADHAPEALRRLAIEAGVALIEERGYAHFSARAVANRIGYTVGTLYHIFGNLHEFMLHINAATLDLWYQEFEKALRKRTARRRPYHALHTLARTYIQFCRAHSNRWSCLYEHRLPATMRVPEWYEKKTDRLFNLVEDALIPYAGRRYSVRAAKILWAGIHGLCVLSISAKLDVVGAQSAQVLGRDLIDNFLSGLKHRRQKSRSR